VTDLLSGYVGTPLAEIVVGLIASVVLITFMLLSAIFFVWLERKVSARIQDRLGPTRVGGKFGWLQTLADGLKLLVKEDIIPAQADQMLFRIGPYIALVGSFMAFLALPFGKGVVALEMNIAIFYILAVMSAEVFGIILGAYGSSSKWALFGGIREAAQIVSYEVPRAISVVVPVIVAGTMNLTTISEQQSGPFWNWYLFHDPFTFCAFWVFFTCGTASCKRAPFDLAEAESELVAGFHTEYSGFRWLIFFMAEYGSMFAISGIASILFLGGWNLGVLPSGDMTDVFISLFGQERHTFGMIVGNIINVAVFILKGWILVFVMMWVRWTLPRLRIDQVMLTCLRYLLPISCVLLVGVCLWQLFAAEVPYIRYINWLLAAAMLLGTVLLFWKAITRTQQSPTAVMPGVWRGGRAMAPEVAQREVVSSQ
jgi:NADH-quinone oxidoreductase subunit H